jgi:2-keto-3-deoxy-L-rhamnonate aldolase RhmA
MAEPVKENKIRTIWKSGGAVINGWLGIPSSVAAENMAQANWDGLTVDLQHGLVDYPSAVTMMQAISTVGTPTDVPRRLARARHHHEAARRRCLSASSVR